MPAILPGLLYRISNLDNSNNHYFPGTSISTAIYEHTYAELGQLIGELYSAWEQSPMHWGPADPFRFEDYDYCNGFEEFVCTIFEHWCANVGLFDHDGDFDRDRLKQLVDLFEDATHDEIYDRMGIALVKEEVAS